MIGVNVNNARFMDYLCPWFFADKGALFVPFSSRILTKALEPWIRGPLPPGHTDDWSFGDTFYTSLGYTLINNTAVLPPAPNPFAAGLPRPPWAR